MTNSKFKKKAKKALAATAAFTLLTGGLYFFRGRPQPADSPPPKKLTLAGARSYTPAPQADWPWKVGPNVSVEETAKGVTHWLNNDAADGTEIDLFEFDFVKNPALRLELYDQDGDPPHQSLDWIRYWNKGVWQTVREINQAKKGEVVAAWNGLFFDLNGQGSLGAGRHLTPEVINGKLRYGDLDTYRWTFGVKYKDGKPIFSVKYIPSPESLIGDFDYCSGAAQCVIRYGKALKLEPFPAPGAEIPRSHGCKPDEAGYIPFVDHMKVSRTSLGWSADSRYLDLLFVKSPSSEVQSALALKHDQPIEGGWTLFDIQRFWIAKGVWSAINSDGGGPAQLAFLQKGGDYTYIPPRWASNNNRVTMPANATGGSAGGSLMYFYVRNSAN